MKTTDRRGFTIIEILVVLVVLAILVAMSVGIYLNWQRDTAETEVKNDLTAASSALKNNRNFKNIYPANTTDLAEVFKPSSGVSVNSYTLTGGGTGFCLTLRSNRISDVVFYINESIDKPQAGATCP